MDQIRGSYLLKHRDIKMTEQLIKINGALGEGGGQMLRSSLALSICQRKPFVMENIRAKRKKPGLLRQHLTAVKAAARISNAEVEGAELGSQSLVFKPQAVQAGDYHFSIGSAGSATLVLQTILCPLLFANGASKIIIEGGTHNPMAPPFEFINRVFVPVLNKMGANIRMTLTRYGFFPAGGGQIMVEIEPLQRLYSLRLYESGKLIGKNAKVLLSQLPMHIAQRELDALKKHLNWKNECFHIFEVKAAFSAANLISILLEYENVNEVITVFGERGLKAEKVAKNVAALVETYCTVNVPVGEHLADQLLLPMALAGEGEFVTVTPSQHSLTNMQIIESFLPVSFLVENQRENTVKVSLSKRESSSER